MIKPRKGIAIAAMVLLAACGWLLYGAVEKTRQRYMQAYITQGLADANSAKSRVIMAHDEKGKWPSSNAESSLPPPSSYATDAISALDISEGGVITVTFTGKSSVKDGKLRLTPHEGMDIRWQCTTPSFKEIETWAPQCKYEE